MGAWKLGQSSFRHHIWRLPAPLAWVGEGEASDGGYTESNTSHPHSVLLQGSFAFMWVALSSSKPSGGAKGEAGQRDKDIEKGNVA